MIEKELYVEKLLTAARAVSDSDRVKIIRLFESRKVGHLLHFTDVTNLRSIMDNGLLSRELLLEKEINFRRSDQHRLDLLSNSISLSITHPNKKMMYFKRQNEKDLEFVVLEISLNILYEKYSKFVCMPNNAASQTMIKEAWDSPENFVGYKGLTRIFPSKPDRVKWNMSAKVPQNIQSEIMFFGAIESTKIQIVHSQNSLSETKPEISEYLRNNFPNLKVCNNCKHGAIF